MITLYKWDESPDYEKIGHVVLTPISCVARNVAGGNYDLTLVHPVDDGGKWRSLQTGNIIKIPVQEEIIENAYTGTDMWIYETAVQAALRAGASEPTPVSYTAWSDATDYDVGDKCSYDGRNYQCTYFDQGSGQRFVPPPNSPWFKEISGSSGGAAVLATLQPGTKLIWIEGQYADTWWKMCTWGGLVGWIKQSQLTNEQHQTQEEVQPIRILSQLFRITSVTVDTKEMRATVEAQHVSYDANGSLIKEAVISQASAPMAIYMAEQGMFEPYEAGMICSNLSTTDASYTQTIRGKSLMWALLDPKSGIVPAFDAAFKRDNWDLYIVQKTELEEGEEPDFKIRYGLNLLGVTWQRSAADVITRVIPVAKDENGGDLYLEDVYVDSELIDDYPVIRMELLSVSGQVGKDKGDGTGAVWTEADLLDEMEAQAEKRFSVDHADAVAVEVTVDFTMLGDTAEYAQYKRLETALLYDIVWVYDERIWGQNPLELRVTEVEWDAVREKVNAVKLSNVRAYKGGTVAGYMMLPQSVTADTIGRQTMDQIIQTAADRAVQILK